MTTLIAPDVALQRGQQLLGFTVRQVTPLPSLRAIAYELEHPRSGARLLHVHSNDTENLFSITFPTPPPDDTGLPHILEHAVLGGSRKYPVKEPFFEMIKMSMATFINAMTSDACTLYPVASSVRKDFFNLAEVYFDAVFHPLLTEDTFRREGHHLALADAADPDSELRLKGIVYNEMKGAYSNPETLVYRAASCALFPDTPMGRDAGGDPQHIPSLSYEQFKQFHESGYHPGNAYFFLYGDIAPEEHLRFLAERLDGFERRDGTPPLARQPRWREPRVERRTYPAGAGEPLEGRTFLTLGWLVGDATDADDVVALEVLDRVLLGNEAAPLKKAIIDSQLGADLFYAGFGETGHESVFRVGLKGSEPDRAEAFLKLVLETLERIAQQGVAREQIDSAFQQLAYQHLEIQTLFPLRLMWPVVSTWIFGGDPLTYLRMPELLERCRQRYEAEPDLLGRLIRERLLANPHRLLMTFVPDREMQARQEAQVAQRLQQRRATLSRADLRQIGATAAALEAAQGVPNPPEALVKLPQLHVSDLPAKPRHIPTTTERLDSGVTVLRNDVFANGVNYLQLDCDLAGLPAELYPYLPRYDEAFAKLGAAGQPYTRIAQRRAAHSGGVACSEAFFTHASEPQRCLRRIGFGLKTLDAQVEPALALLRDLIFALDPRDADRLHDVVRQSRARYRTSLVSNGTTTALRHAGRGLSPECHLNQLTSGLPQLALIQSLAEKFDQRCDELMQRIEMVRDFLLQRGRWTVSFTGSPGAYDLVCRTLDGWFAQMRAQPVQDAPLPFDPYLQPPREGLAAPMQVAFCGMVMPAPHGTHPDAPLLDLGARFMSLDYMLNEVRLKGNAYGGGCYYSEMERTFGMQSYRDPRLNQTLDVFRRLLDYVRRAEWTQVQIERAIIGAAKHAERPIRPGEATDMALRRHIRGDTPHRREERYARMLAATPASVRRVLLEQLETNLPRAAVCVVSSREKLEQANRERPEQALGVEDILV